MSRPGWCAACLAVLALLAGGPSTAAAVTIGFDDVPSGTPVDDRYGGLGVRFGPSPFAGISGALTASARPQARSAPNAAALAYDQADDFSSSWIRFDEAQRLVRLHACRTGGAGAPQTPNVNVLAYDAAGTLIDNQQQIECTLNGPLVPITVAVEGIRWINVAGTGDGWAIDDLEFGPGVAPPDPTPTPTPTPAVTPDPTVAPPPEPTARFTPALPSKTLPRSSWVSAATSVAATGLRITRYDWDFDLDGRYETSCGGEAPAVSRPFRTPGVKRVGLRVVDSLGRASTTRQSITVGRRAANTASRAASVFTCEDPGADQQPDRADCVKSFGFRIVDVNSRGRDEDCFEIEARMKAADFARARPAQLGTLERSRYYRATVRGPVSLNGLYLPLPRNLETSYDSGTGRIGIEGAPDLAFGGYRLLDVDLSKEVPARLARSGAKRTFPIGSFDVAKSVAKPLLGLKLGPSASVALLDRASEVTLGVKLPSVFSFNPFRSEPAEGKVTLTAANTRPVELDGAEVKVPTLFVGPLLVSDFFLKGRLRDTTWTGGGGLRLAPLPLPALQAVPPPPDNGFGLKDGRFDHAGVTLDFPLPGTRPLLFPGVSLRRIGAAIGVRPTRFTGTAGIAVAEVAEVDGGLFGVLATPDEPYEFPGEDAAPGLGALAGRQVDSTTVAVGGDVSVTARPLPFRLQLGSGYVFYAYPDYAEFGGRLGWEHEYFTLTGQAGGFIAVRAERFNLEGSFEACLRKPFRVCAPDVGAVVSSRGIGFCTVVPVPNPLAPLGPATIPVPGGVGYHWGDTVPQIMVFSCDYGGYREERPRARASQAQTAVDLPGGLPAAQFLIRGAGGVPHVTITAPGGEQLVTDDAGRLDGDVAVIPQPEAGRVLVAVREPAAGRWTVAPRAGSVPVAGVATARATEAPRVRARVTGRGRTRTLRYRITGSVPDRVVFSERGTRTYRALGAAKRARGSLTFAPAEGRAGQRRIVATLERDGIPTRAVPVATYRAPADRRPARPRALRLRRSGGAVVARWRRVPGATRYAVTARLPGGSRVLRVVGRPRVRLAAPRGRVTVRVSATAAGGRTGPAAAATLRGR